MLSLDLERSVSEPRICLNGRKVAVGEVGVVLLIVSRRSRWLEGFILAVGSVVDTMERLHRPVHDGGREKGVLKDV